MLTRNRLLAASVVVAGAALLASPATVEATPMPTAFLNDLLRGRYCCGVDTNGDHRADTYCCYLSGCAIDSRGCVAVT